MLIKQEPIDKDDGAQIVFTLPASSRAYGQREAIQDPIQPSPARATLLGLGEAESSIREEPIADEWFLGVGDDLPATGRAGSPYDSVESSFRGYDNVYPTRKDLTRDVSQLESEVHKLQKKLSQEKADHQKTKRYLKTTSEELRAAGMLLGKTDSLSYADVNIMAKDLNHQIFELAARIVDAALSKSNAQVKDKRGSTLVKVRDARVGVTAMKVVGKGFFEMVERLGRESSTRTNHQSTLMQYTLQSWLVSFCYKYMDKLRWSHDGGEERALRRVYERFVGGEHKHQMLAGRWRTLTREICRLGFPQPDAHQLGKEMLFGLKPVLRAFGFCSASEHPGWVSQFSDAAASLVDTLLQIDTAIKEQVSTVDILPVVVPPGSVFNAEWMKDGGSGNRRPSELTVGQTVMVPVGLGFTWTKHENQHSATEYLVNPQVVLYSAFL